MGKRSKAATKGLRPKVITSAQRKARKINIEKARRSLMKKGKYLRSTESAEYLGARSRGKSKSEAREFAMMKAVAQSKRFL